MPPTEEELGWARAIKCAALAKELEPVSDMLYLQMAVVSKAKVKKAVKRLEKLQEFRRKYNIIDAETDDAVALLRGSYALFPGFLGAIGRDSEGRAVLVSHVSKYLPAKLEPDEWRTMLVAGYYMFNAFNADVEEVRKGVVFVTDCRGMGWKNFSLTAQKKNAELFQGAYPVRLGTMYLLDAPPMMAAMLRILKPILSKKMQKSLKLGEVDSFFNSDTIPYECVPKWFKGGQASDEAAFIFLEEQLAKRMENEKKNFL